MVCLLDILGSGLKLAFGDFMSVPARFSVAVAPALDIM